MSVCYLYVVFFRQKTAYEMRISDWSSDVCSSDLLVAAKNQLVQRLGNEVAALCRLLVEDHRHRGVKEVASPAIVIEARDRMIADDSFLRGLGNEPVGIGQHIGPAGMHGRKGRSEEHTSELQSLMRISYAVFCLTKKKSQHNKRASNV